MSCLHPLVRIDESSFLFDYNFKKLRSLLPNKKPYRGGFFFNLDDFASKFENINEFKYLRDRFLSRKDVSLIPCGNCFSCLLKYSRDWSIRTFLQANKTESNRFNYFVTLTYDEMNVPKDDFILENTNEIVTLNILVKSDIQKFLKRLRKRYGDDIKYYLCGEYGPKTQRPHYHLILLNMPEIQDRDFLSQSGTNIFFSSPTFNELWSFGFHSISDCSIDTIFYTSHYCLKKNGKPKIKLKPFDNSHLDFQNEFQLMSRRPGLAEDWFLTRIYDENKNLIETNVKINDLSFQVSSIKYYDYLLERQRAWKPIKPFQKDKLLSIYNNSYLTLEEQEQIKLDIKNSNSLTLRTAI